jgi:hypothetical protein
MKIKEFNTIRQQVRTILHENVDCRNSDCLLICKWLEEFRGISSVNEIKENYQDISFESIRRARQLIQAQGDYLPTDETIIKRRRLQAIYEQVISRMEG